MAGPSDQKKRERSVTPESSSSAQRDSGAGAKKMKRGDEEEHTERSSEIGDLEESSEDFGNPKGKGKMKRKVQDRDAPVKNSIKAQRKGVTYAQMDAVNQGLVAGTVDLSIVTPFEIEISEELNNLSKLRQYRKNLEAASKERSPKPVLADSPLVAPTDLTIRHLHQLFDGPVLNERELTAEMREQQKSSMRKTARYVVGIAGTEMRDGKKHQINIQFNVPNSSAFYVDLNLEVTYKGQEKTNREVKAKNILSQIFPSLLRLVERYPLLLPQNIKGSFTYKGERVLIWNAAARNAFGDEHRVLLPKITWTEATKSYESRIEAFNGSTGILFEPHIRQIRVGAQVISTTIKIPDLPLGVAAVDPLTIMPKGLSDQLKEIHERAIRVMQHLLFVLKGCTVKNEAALHDVITAHVKKFSAGHKTKTFRGVYDGKPLTRRSMSVNVNRIYVMPSAALQKRHPLLFAIALWGTSVHCYNLVAAKIILTFLATGDSIASWEAGCKEADGLNSRMALGEPLPLACQCLDPSTSEAFHLCERCSGSFACATLLRTSYGILFCDECQRAQGKIQQYFKMRLGKAHTLECQKLSLDATSQGEKLRKQAMVEDVMTNFATDTGNLVDIYSSKHRQQQDSHALFETHPLQPSVEAVFAVALSIVDSKKTMRYHCAGNVGPTAMFLNFLKHGSPPPLISVMKRFFLDYQKGMSDENLEYFIRKFDDLHLITIKIPYMKRQRLGKAPNMRNLAELRHELWTGIPGKAFSTQARNDRLKFLSTKFRVPGDVNRQAWEPYEGGKDFSRLKSLILEMETHFNKKMRVGKDGAPYPFSGTMLDTWCWLDAWLLFSDRAYRLWLWCNGRWVTVDCTETIFLECVWQFLDPEFLPLRYGLPLTIFIRHPLRFVVGHLKHKQQLRTGWTIAKPVSMADRDASLNNSLIESSAWNFAKHNYDDAQVELMIDDFIQNTNEFVHPAFDRGLSIYGAGTEGRLDSDDEEIEEEENDDCDWDDPHDDEIVDEIEEDEEDADQAVAG